MRDVSMSGASGQGKVVVITGALGALGKVVVEEALSRGARVAGIDHAASQLAATAKRVEFGRIDLTDAAQAKKAVDAAAAHFGAIDALINIAGGFTFETIADGDPKAWQRMYALNLETALNASRAAIPYQLAGGPHRQYRRDGRSAGWLRHGSLWGVEGGRAQADGVARCRTER